MNQLVPFLSILAAVSAGVIIIAEDNRIRIGLLAIQYIWTAFLAGLTIPLQISLIKLITGSCVILILLITVHQLRGFSSMKPSELLPAGRPFRMIAVLLVSTVTLGIGRSGLFSGLPINPAVIASAFLLGVLGLLQLGLLSSPIEIAVGLLTVLNGFEILYSPMERSLAVFGLLAAVHVGIALSISIVILDRERMAGG